MPHKQIPRLSNKPRAGVRADELDLPGQATARALAAIRVKDQRAAGVGPRADAQADLGPASARAAQAASKGASAGSTAAAGRPVTRTATCRSASG